MRNRPAHISLGAGFSSVDSLVGTVEYNEGNSICSIPSSRRTSEAAGRSSGCTLPWASCAGLRDFLYRAVVSGPKIALGVDLFYRDLAYLSPNDLYTESKRGGKVGGRGLWGAIFSGGA